MMYPRTHNSINYLHILVVSTLLIAFTSCISCDSQSTNSIKNAAPNIPNLQPTPPHQTLQNQPPLCIYPPPTSLQPPPATALSPPASLPTPPSLPPPSPYTKPEHAVWCVGKPMVPASTMQAALDYACSSGADCQPVQVNGACFQPDTVLAHASFAFNSYWQKNKMGGGTCDFGGSAMLVTVDPSYDKCHFLST